MSVQKLILERDSSNEYTPIVEASGNGEKSYYIEGIFAQAEVKNVNQRMYPLDVLQESVATYVEKFVSKKRALGELGHPATASINEDRCSHLITDIRQDGYNFIGRAKIMDTPMGKIVKNFIDEGIKLAVSTRGVGRMEKTNGISVVQPNYKMITVDIVVDPSGPDCFVDNIMESTEYIYDAASGIWVAEQAADEMIKTINESPSIDNAEVVKMFSGFIQSLRT